MRIDECPSKNTEVRRLTIHVGCAFSCFTMERGIVIKVSMERVHVCVVKRLIYLSNIEQEHGLNYNRCQKHKTSHAVQPAAVGVY